MRVRTGVGAAVAAVLIVTGLALAGCQNPAGADGAGKPTLPTMPTLPSLSLPKLTLPSGVTTHWTMPNEVGANLQDAQDAIQKLTHDGIFYTSSHDVTGQGRHQILDRDWKVCSQNVPTGSAITIGTKIDFGAVKNGEACP
jgi:hypothetical protein